MENEMEMKKKEIIIKYVEHIWQQQHWQMIGFAKIRGFNSFAFWFIGWRRQWHHAEQLLIIMFRCSNNRVIRCQILFTVQSTVCSFSNREDKSRTWTREKK